MPRIRSTYESPSWITVSSAVLREPSTWARAQGLKVLGVGTTRIVYALDGRSVLKLDAYRWYNRKEAERWERVRSTPHRRHFARVLAVDPEGHWLVMERAVGTLRDVRPSRGADPLSRDWWPKCQAVAKGLKIRDLHDSNIGRMRDGRYAVIDYGD